MITKEQLTAAGYKPFNQIGIREYTKSFWQKRFDDDKGKKYFITIAEYDNLEDKNRQFSQEFSYSPFTQFETHGATFDVEMLNPQSVEQMEEFFENIWFKMDCNYYEEWD